MNLPMPSARPVILDTDIGSDIDDTWALAALLRSPELRPLLITTATGDTRHRAAIVAKLLETAGRTDISIGLGPSSGPMADRFRHQGPWVDSYRLEDFPGTVHEDGVGAIIETLLRSPEPVTLIAIAPCTNIAAALARAPEIAPKCDLVAMAGSFRVGYAPGSPPEAETNVRCDVPAFRALLAAPWRSLCLLPLDVCIDAVLAGERYARIRACADPLIRACMENYRIWARRVDWMTVDYEETRTSILFDNLAVTLAYDERYFAFEEIRCLVTEEGLTLDHPDGRPLRAAGAWKDLEGFLDHLAGRLGACEKFASGKSGP
ncbi:MAG: nucleoside hydrolase [Opitutales bacterium]|nr:nucleoside hydrolase [Opitutales bacterium]